jgi:hypothetical protein
MVFAQPKKSSGNMLYRAKTKLLAEPIFNRVGNDRYQYSQKLKAGHWTDAVYDRNPPSHGTIRLHSDAKHLYG